MARKALKAPKQYKRFPINAAERLRLRQHHAKYALIKQAELAIWFYEQFGHLISQATVSGSLSDKFKDLDDPTKRIKDGIQRIKQGYWPELEAALFEWFQRCEVKVILSTEHIRMTAERLWNELTCYEGLPLPDFSNRWVDRFKNRHDIKQRTRHGEANSVDDAATEEQLVEIREIIALYDSADVYNCDESGLFWKSIPKRGLSTQPIAGSKQMKCRITAHFTCNATGTDKPPPWFIGTTINPRSFVNSISFGLIDTLVRPSPGRRRYSLWTISPATSLLNRTCLSLRLL